MKVITRFQIREDVEAMERAMVDETFLRATDPSVSVMSFIERASSQLGAIKHAYAHSMNDRNGLPDEIRPYLNAMRDACDALERSLEGPPEDDNRDLEPGMMDLHSWEG